MSEIWYKDGLQFECRKCGGCCSGFPGVVWVTDEEISVIAKEMGYGKDVFEAKYTRTFAAKKSLGEFANYDCVLFDSEKKGCAQYSVRPVQCRSWPFWPDNIKTKKDWIRTAKRCRGCDHGRLYSLEEIETQRALMLSE